MSIDHFDMIIAHQITSRRRGYLQFAGLTLVALIILIGIVTM
jgi:hypothetical protein